MPGVATSKDAPLQNRDFSLPPFASKPDPIRMGDTVIYHEATPMRVSSMKTEAEVQKELDRVQDRITVYQKDGECSTELECIQDTLTWVLGESLKPPSELP